MSPVRTLPACDTVAPGGTKRALLDAAPTLAADLTVPLLVVVAVYVGSVTATFGFTDDYSVLLSATRNNSELIELDAGGGRPLTGLVHEVTLSLATDVSSLRWVRLFSIVAILVCAAVAVGIGRSFGLGRIGAGALAVAVSVVPGMQMLAVWAVMAPAAWATAFGLGAIWLHTLANRGSAGRDKRLLAASLACSVLAWSLYQPSALVVIPGVVASGIARATRVGDFVKHLLSGALIVVMSVITYAVMFAISTAMVESFVEERSRATDDLAAKLDWFYTDVLVRASQPWDLTPSSRVSLALMIALMAAIFVTGRDVPVGLRFLRVGAAFLSLPAAYASNIYVAEQWPSARSRLGLEIGLLLLVGAAVSGIGRSTRAAEVRRAGAFMGAAAALALAATAAWNTSSMVVHPQSSEYAALRAMVRDADIRPDSRVVIRLASRDESLARTVVLDEFGIPTSAQPWAALDLVRLEVLRARGFVVEAIEVIGPDDRVDGYADEVVILDLRARLGELGSG